LAIIPNINLLCGPKTSTLLQSIGNLIYKNLKIGQSLAVDPISILTILLPIITFLVGSNTFIRADSTINWIEPIILYSLLIGKKGTRKSPILKVLIDPLCKAVKASENEGIDYIFLEGTLEGMTQQLMRNNGEMLQVSNESETFFNKLYSVKGKLMKE
jgi:hypothetical protein